MTIPNYGYRFYTFQFDGNNADDADDDDDKGFSYATNMVDDMALDDEQLDACTALCEYDTRRKREIRSDFPVNKWTLPIPVMIDATIMKASKL